MSDPLGATLRRQEGIVTRAQCLAAGETPAGLRHRLVEGERWQVVLPGIYATFTGTLTDRQRLWAGLLLGGQEALLTGATVMRLRGMRYGPQDRRVHVLVPARRSVGSRGFVRVTGTTLLPRAVRVDGRFPAAPTARAVIDGCRPLRSLRDVRAALCEAVQRRLCSCDELAAVLAAGHSGGSALPRRALADAAAGCRSAPECELRDLVLTSPLLRDARFNQVLPGSGGLIPDAWWPEARLVAEIDSVEWHGFGEAPEQTERRRARLAALGCRVVPISPRWLREHSGEVLRTLERAYLAGLGVATP